jgi:hypothetical protein
MCSLERLRNFVMQERDTLLALDILLAPTVFLFVVKRVNVN